MKTSATNTDTMIDLMSDSSPPVFKKKRQPIIPETPSSCGIRRRKLKANKLKQSKKGSKPAGKTLKTSKFFDLQSKESGHTDSSNINSTDDADATDDSFVTNGSASDASFSAYVAGECIILACNLFFMYSIIVQVCRHKHLGLVLRCTRSEKENVYD